MAFYLTTPIYYVNDSPHIGHAYTTTVADTLVRYHKARGRRAFLLTGTDEHGEKIAEAAGKQGVTPKALADKVVERFRTAWKALLVEPDDFIRTTDERHQKVVLDLWQRLEAAGDIYLGEYEGLYCIACEGFYTELQLLPGNLCPTHHRPVQLLKETSYFFRMSKYQDALLAHFEANPDFVQPEVRRNEILSFIRGGLRDLSISRTTFDWGIKVPGDPKHVMYVWLDALTNYISALGGPGAPLYDELWPGIHLIGKDILRFHSLYWPTFLLSAGLPLPKKIFAHGWWMVSGQKISKSLPATKVDPLLLAGDIGPDALRYYLLREVPLGHDGDFTYEGLIGRLNSDLANDLGNLVNRTLAMVEKYAGGVVPAAQPALDEGGPHAELKALAEKQIAEVERHFEAFAPSRALEALWELVRGANRYVDSAQPWTLVKDPSRRAELDHVLHTFCESVLWCGTAVWPAMPKKAEELFAKLSLSGRPAWPSRWNQELAAGTKVQKGEALFPRIDDDRKAQLLDRWIPPEVRGEPAPRPAVTEPLVPPVAFEDFGKLDLRVAEVKAAEKVPKADKLLKVTLDVGEDKPRTVVAGIAEAFAPEAIVGKRVIYLANLAPRKIRGVESQGMILAAGDEKVLALSSTDAPVPPGTKIR
jgi:methionyl-tRNA synthetase